MKKKSRKPLNCLHCCALTFAELGTEEHVSFAKLRADLRNVERENAGKDGRVGGVGVVSSVLTGPPYDLGSTFSFPLGTVCGGPAHFLLFSQRHLRGHALAILPRAGKDTVVPVILVAGK